MTEMRLELEQLARTATRCRECFIDGRVRAPYIDVAQPRWVGPQYWDSRPRIAILMINPGSSPKGSASARSYLPRLRAFRDGRVPLDDLFGIQRKNIEAGWRRFRQFFLDDLELKLDELAFANVAWCATAENKYPRWMLDHCFSKHTGPLLQLLRPSIVLASGRPVRRFARQMNELSPAAHVIEVLHYAHRKGRAAQVSQLRRVHQQIANLVGTTSRLTRG
jgi:hypothetical protein